MQPKPTADNNDKALRWMSAHPIVLALVAAISCFLLVFAGGGGVGGALIGAGCMAGLGTFTGLVSRRAERRAGGRHGGGSDAQER